MVLVGHGLLKTWGVLRDVTKNSIFKDYQYIFRTFLRKEGVMSLLGERLCICNINLSLPKGGKSHCISKFF